MPKLQRRPLLLACLGTLALSLSGNTLAQNTYGLPWDDSETSADQESFNPDDYIGYTSPPVQVLRHHKSIGAIDASQIFIDERSDGTAYEIELENQSFKGVKFRWQLQWYNEAGDLLGKRSGWSDQELAPFTSLTLESPANASADGFLILHLDQR